MKGWRRAVLLLAVLGWSVSTAGALEIQSGRLRLVLHENSGRFSLYLGGAGEGGRDLPLLVDDDPRTSFTSLFVENRIYRLGDSPEFRGKAEKTVDGAAFFWESSRIRATMSFSPLSSRPDGERNAVKISLRVRNLTQSELAVGARLLLDSHLGEGAGAHFLTDRGQEIERETTVGSSELLRYWASVRKRKEGTVGVECLVDGRGLTRPDRLVFANWKRLSDAVWLYETAGSRNFSHEPYSVNDSAVALHYDPQSLPAGEEREVALVLGEYDPTGYISVTGSTPRAQVSAAAAAGDPTAIVRELQEVDALIGDIDARLQAGLEPAPDELQGAAADPGRPQPESGGASPGPISRVDWAGCLNRC